MINAALNTRGPAAPPRELIELPARRGHPLLEHAQPRNLAPRLALQPPVLKTLRAQLLLARAQPPLELPLLLRVPRAILPHSRSELCDIG